MYVQPSTRPRCDVETKNIHATRRHRVIINPNGIFIKTSRATQNMYAFPYQRVFLKLEIVKRHLDFGTCYALV